MVKTTFIKAFRRLLTPMGTLECPYNRSIVGTLKRAVSCVYIIPMKNPIDIKSQLDPEIFHLGREIELD